MAGLTYTEITQVLEGPPPDDRLRKVHIISAGSEVSKQIFINCIWPKSVVLPHRHPVTPNPHDKERTQNPTEQFTLIKGHLRVILFDEKGKVSEIHELKQLGESFTVSADTYHTVVVLKPTAVYEEKNGFYNEKTDKQWMLVPDLIANPNLEREEILKLERTSKALNFHNFSCRCEVGDCYNPLIPYESPFKLEVLSSLEALPSRRTPPTSLQSEDDASTKSTPERPGPDSIGKRRRGRDVGASTPKHRPSQAGLFSDLPRFRESSGQRRRLEYGFSSEGK
ncbi:MAG: hypothetical protein A3F17_00925 [Gammaproteobacteria bacterium RIFCSPHIGHO2_12_FULL_41_15]|nr:MAG: hypothetical protein A3F17_00925 [Gammaproteobacteria bacterium RIFCSPHIGHO2_12_FULL_41_15]